VQEWVGNNLEANVTAQHSAANALAFGCRIGIEEKIVASPFPFYVTSDVGKGNAG
jgi:hypothetical protein